VLVRRRRSSWPRRTGPERSRYSGTQWPRTLLVSTKLPSTTFGSASRLGCWVQFRPAQGTGSRQAPLLHPGVHGLLLACGKRHLGPSCSASSERLLYRATRITRTVTRRSRHRVRRRLLRRPGAAGPCPVQGHDHVVVVPGSRRPDQRPTPSVPRLSGPGSLPRVRDRSRRAPRHLGWYVGTAEATGSPGAGRPLAN
jgi:hypothetical protein